MRLVTLCIFLFLPFLSWCQNQEEEEVIKEEVISPSTIWVDPKKTYPVYLGCEDHELVQQQNECTQTAISQFITRNSSYPDDAV